MTRPTDVSTPPRLAAATPALEAALRARWAEVGLFGPDGRHRPAEGARGEIFTDIVERLRTMRDPNAAAAGTAPADEAADQVAAMGADVLRLWAAGAAYSEDFLRIGAEILRPQMDLYRDLRRTLDGLLKWCGEPAAEVPVADLPELERWLLHRLAVLDAQFRRACDALRFEDWFAELAGFCRSELTGFYLAAREDSLRHDPPSSPRRRAAGAAVHATLDALCRWLAPFCRFTAEEVWRAFRPDAPDALAAQGFPRIPDAWRDADLGARFELVVAVCRTVAAALADEEMTSLASRPVLYVDGAAARAVAGLDMAELCRTSGLLTVEGAVPEGVFRMDGVADVGVAVCPAEGERCRRCGKVLHEVGFAHSHLCGRCFHAVGDAPLVPAE